MAACAAAVMVATLAATGPAVAGDKARVGATPKESGANYTEYLLDNPRAAAKICVQYALYPHAAREVVVEAVKKKGDMGEKRAQRHWLFGYRPALNDYCRSWQPRAYEVG